MSAQVEGHVKKSDVTADQEQPTVDLAQPGILERWAKPGSASLLALVTAIATFIAAAVLIFPELKREPVVAMGATVSNVSLEERPVGNAAGNLISYEVEFIGYKEDRVYVYYALFNPAELQRIDPSNDADDDAILAASIKADASSDRGKPNFVVPLPPGEGICAFVRVYIFDSEDRSNRLDYADSPPFDTRSATNRACENAGISASTDSQKQRTY